MSNANADPKAPNWPSKKDKPSGKGRDNNPPKSPPKK
jgi:hypothetical protein